MRVLLDTCVLSELRNPRGDQNVRSAVASLRPGETFLSVITLGEISKGISLLTDDQKKRDLEYWFPSVERSYADRILPVDRDTAIIWGELTAVVQRRGIQLHAADGLIAATAIQHGLHVMTRNVRHFDSTGVLIINPWSFHDQ